MSSENTKSSSERKAKLKQVARWRYKAGWIRSRALVMMKTAERYNERADELERLLNDS